MYVFVLLLVVVNGFGSGLNSYGKCQDFRVVINGSTALRLIHQKVHKGNDAKHAMFVRLVQSKCSTVISFTHLFLDNTPIKRVFYMLKMYQKLRNSKKLESME